MKDLTLNRRHAGQETNTTNTDLPISLLAIIETDLQQATKRPSIPRTHINPKVNVTNRTRLAETCDRARTIWIIGQGSETATLAMSNLRLTPLPLKATDKDEHWKAQTDVPDLRTFLPRSDRDRHRGKIPEENPEWILVPLTHRTF
jgi:hypothetical protein